MEGGKDETVGEPSKVVGARERGEHGGFGIEGGY